MHELQLQFEGFLHSLDFPGRTALKPKEIAERLGCSEQHILNQIEAGALRALNIRGPHATKKNYMRVPVECYRDWIVKQFTVEEDRKRLLRDLPRATLRELQREIAAILSPLSA